MLPLQRCEGSLGHRCHYPIPPTAEDGMMHPRSHRLYLLHFSAASAFLTALYDLVTTDEAYVKSGRWH
jgi:hypothetical protein